VNKASESELGALHGIVVRYLAEKIASGEASASDVANAIKMLKDNAITCIAEEGSALDDLRSKLSGKRREGMTAAELDLSDALESVEFTKSRMQ
jgi:ABC-type Zn uptake system ZnuABC Zn-binding protein ZnuA